MMAHGVHRLAGRVRKVGRFAGKAPETLPADDADCRLHPQNVAGISTEPPNFFRSSPVHFSSER